MSTLKFMQISRIIGEGEEGLFLYFVPPGKRSFILKEVKERSLPAFCDTNSLLGKR